MTGDAAYPDPESRIAVQAALLAYFSQKPFIGGVEEQFDTLQYTELKADYQAADTAATKSTTATFVQDFFEVNFKTALYRDMTYLTAGRRQMKALGYHDAYHRCYRAAKCALLVGVSTAPAGTS